MSHFRHSPPFAATRRHSPPLAPCTFCHKTPRSLHLFSHESRVKLAPFVTRRATLAPFVTSDEQSLHLLSQGLTGDRRPAGDRRKFAPFLTSNACTFFHKRRGGPVGWGHRLARRRGRLTINSVLLRIPANSPPSVLNMSTPSFLSKNFLQNFGFTMVDLVVRLGNGGPSRHLQPGRRSPARPTEGDLGSSGGVRSCEGS